MPTVQRKVLFYRTRLVVNDDSEASPDPRALLAEAERLIIDGDLYQEIEDGEAVIVLPERVGNRVALRVGGVRRSGLPWLEEGGSVQPLSIAERQGLIEQTHMVFFEDGVVGVEFNFYGPRMNRLLSFLRAKCPAIPPFSAEILLNRDASEQVKHLKDIRLMDLRVNRGYLDVFDEAAPNLFRALDGVAENLGGSSVELVIRPEIGTRDSLAQRALDVVRAIAGNPRTKEGADRFRVRGLGERTSRVELVDLLKDQLVSTRRVAQQDSRHRGVHAGSMFAEIEAAYGDLHESIRRAAGIEG